jgi:protein tyrosine/serine phosphatase
VWSAPDVFVNVTVVPAATVRSAGEKQKVHEPVPDLIVTTGSVVAAACARAARCGRERVVVVVGAGAVVDVVVEDVLVVVLVVDSGGTVVVVSAANATAGDDPSAMRTRNSRAARRRMIDPQELARTHTDRSHGPFESAGCARVVQPAASSPARRAGNFAGVMSAEPQARPRRIPLERAFNFRDLGGYTIGSGRTVRWGLVYRADGIHRIEGADLARVAALGIRTVLDLRTRGELTDHGRVAAESMNASYHHLPLLEKIWERDLLAAELDAVEFLAGRYLAMLDQGAASIVSALDTMADAERLPVVFHCSAGKDRTGVLAAVLLSVLGVSDDDIAADYALSRTAMREMAEWVRTERPESYETMSAQPPAFLDAPPLAMRRFLALARTTYGSLTEYVADAGFSADGVDALRAALLTA